MERKPILYIMCGCSGSGKSTWAHEFIKNNDVRYVSRDEIRLSLIKDNEEYFSHEKEVFRHFANIITQTLVDGFDVIADATHLTINSRKKLTNAIDRLFTNYTIIYVWINTPLDICLARNAKREGLAHVPENVLINMYNTMKCPSLEEDSRAFSINDVTVGDN